MPMIYDITMEDIVNSKQKAQLHCEIFRQLGAKSSDRALTKPLPWRNPFWQESLDRDLIGRLQAGSQKYYEF